VYRSTVLDCLVAVSVIMSLLRPARTRKATLQYTPTNVCAASQSGLGSRQHKYHLNKTNAVVKKLATCGNRVDCEMIFKQNTYILEFSTAAYEAFVPSFYAHFDSPSTSRQCHINVEKRTDKGGSINTDDSVSVRPGPKGTSKKQLYRVNLFHTTCRVEINGCNRQCFIDELHHILKSLLSKGIDFAEMNGHIREQCRLYLSSRTNSDSEVDACAGSSSERTLASCRQPSDAKTVDHRVTPPVDQQVTPPVDRPGAAPVDPQGPPPGPRAESRNQQLAVGGKLRRGGGFVVVTWWGQQILRGFPQSRGRSPE
jgi:hypothetical protein